MDKRIRIHTTPLGGDKFINIDLKQSFDTLDILSLSIKKEDLYKDFSADYGILIGRVNVNGGLGIPNARVSIFIPLDEDDKEDTSISTIYPYEDINNKNKLGYRYNLFIPSKDYNLGSFPSKMEVVKDKVMGEIYKKYYKYTTITNASGDFMLYGIPVGSHTLHIDADLSDIGVNSYTAKELLNSGIPTSGLNIDDNGNYVFKVDSNLDILPQIVSQNVTIDIRPLWSMDNDEVVGITRYDTDFNINFNTYTTFVASMGFDQLQLLEDKQWIGTDYAEMFWYNNTKHGRSDEKMFTPGIVCRVFPYIGEALNQPLGDIMVKVFKYDSEGNRSELLDFTRQESSSLVSDGFLILKLPCYSHKVITDEYGNEVFSNDEQGVPTAGTYHIEITTNDGYVQEGGQYYGYILKNINNKDDSTRGFLMERNRIYTSSMRTRKNRAEVFGMKQVPKFTTGKASEYKRFIHNFKQNGHKDLPFGFSDNDWLNGFLYFGRMANGLSSKAKKNQEPPVEMQYEKDGKIYYKVETRMVDITQVFESVSNSDSYYHFFKSTNEFSQGKIPQPFDKVEGNDISVLPKPLVKDRGQGLYMLMTGCYSSNVNNFNRYKELIKR